MVMAMVQPLFMAAGIAAWLVSGAEETERELEAAIPRIVVPVLSPNSGGVIHSEPAKAAVSVNSPYDPVPMVPAPVAGLIEELPRGPLPRIGADGKTPWQTYARPFFHDDKRPRIALVIGPMGISSNATSRAIEGLPGAVRWPFPRRRTSSASGSIRRAAWGTRSCWNSRWSRPTSPATIPAPIPCWYRWTPTATSSGC